MKGSPLRRSHFTSAFKRKYQRDDIWKKGLVLTQGCYYLTYYLQTQSRLVLDSCIKMLYLYNKRPTTK